MNLNRFFIGTALTLLMTISLQGKSAAATKPLVTEGNRYTFNLPVAYGEWALTGLPDRATGSMTIPLTDGEFELKGTQGWSFKIAIVDGNVIPLKIIPGKYGRDLSGLFCRGKTLTIAQPKGKRVLLFLPKSIGPYSLGKLLPEGIGPRAVFLADGENAVKGKDWGLTLTLKNGVLTCAGEGEPFENDSNPVSIRGTMVIWTGATKAKKTAPATERSLMMSIKRPRKIFARDERLALHLNLTTLEDCTDDLSIIATRATDSFTVFKGPWPAKKGHHQRTFEIYTDIFRPGAYTLTATLGDFSTKLPITISASAVPSTGGIKLIATHSPKNSKIAIESGATIWSMRAALTPAEKSPDRLSLLMEEATLKELPVWLSFPLTDKIQSADLSSIERGKLLGRSAALMAQRAREFTIHRNLIHADFNDGDLTDSFIKAITTPAAKVVGASLCSILLPAGKGDHLAGSHFQVVELTTPKRTAFDCLATLIPPRRSRQAAAKLLVQTMTPQEGWLALGAGITTLLLGETCEPTFAETVKQIGPVIQVLTPFRTAPENVKAAQASAPRHGREGLPSAIAKVTGGDSHVFGFWAEADKCQYLWVFSMGQPGTCKLLPPANGSTRAYELLSGTTLDLPPAPEARGKGLDLSLKTNETRLYAFPRRVPAAVTVQAKIIPKKGGMPVLEYRAQLLDSYQRPISATLPAHITITDASGSVRATRTAAFKRGHLLGIFPLALNEEEGGWKIDVRFIKEKVEVSTATVFSKAEYLAGRRVRDWTELEIEGSAPTRRLLQSGKTIGVVVAKGEHIALAECLCAGLKRRGADARIMIPNELTSEQFMLFDKNSRTRLDLPFPATRVNMPLLLIDEGGCNPLAAEISQRWKLTPFAVTPDFPGNGKGVIQYAWRPFSVDHDALLISGSDQIGLEKAVNYLTTTFLR